MFIPLSSIAFPHIAIFCLTARKMSQFKKTVIFYPLCMVALWVPCVFLGVAANSVKESPQIEAKLQARAQLAAEGPRLQPAERDDLRRQASGDDVLLLLLDRYAPLWLAGILGAGVMAAVMASDSQILALSTMFAEDFFAFYGGKQKFGERVQVQTGRIFVVVLTVVAYAIALRVPESIFALATQYAFSGYAALTPLLVAALFWRRSTRWGALASTVWAASAVIAVAVFQSLVPPQPSPFWSVGGVDVLSRGPAGATVFGFLPVVPMTIISAVLMIVVSLMTRGPSRATVARYFSDERRSE